MKTKTMKKNEYPLFKLGFTTALLIALLLISGISVAQTSGETLYRQNCASCHDVGTKRMIGPGLQGINEKRSNEWLHDWIKDSQAMVKAGDPDAVAIFNEYNQVVMMPFAMLSDQEIDDILTYITEANSAPAVADAGSAEQAAAPAATTPTNAPPSSSQSMTWYLILGLALVILYITGTALFKALKVLNYSGIKVREHRTNHLEVFVVMVVAAALICWGIAAGLEAGIGTLNYVVFAVLPYVALVTFLVGSIYRYRRRSFEVSSLSSQFLEGRKLFWGSQLFHWGILVLFFGHLIAFLFPRTVLAWNGQPVRLLILEVASFAFALSALIGLLLFIRRRLTSPRIRVVSNKMDMLVYTLLLTQIFSGLGVAFFVRWGSSWFAGVLTPYLRSIFAFSPDISAVSTMHWLVQIHIVSAFVIVGIIPFTRFVHFLVAPIDYIWRRYQLVIWNWNRKALR